MYNRFGTAVNLGSVGVPPPTSSWGWDLGLNATSITWLSADEVEVYYDFSESESLADFDRAGDAGVSFNGDGTITITNGSGNIDALIWKQPMLCYEISSSYVISVSGRSAHLNVYCDLTSSWDGSPWNANPANSVVGSGGGAFFNINGSTTSEPLWSYPNTDLVSNLVFQSSPDRSLSNQTGTLIVSYSNSAQTNDSSVTQDLINDTLFPGLDGRVAFGAYETNTIWGNIKFTGKISTP